MSQDAEQRLAAARERVRELSRTLGRDTWAALDAAWHDQLQAERDLAAEHGNSYAQVLDDIPRWDTGAPLPHVISDGSRALVAVRASRPDPGWDGTYVTVVSPADPQPGLFVVIDFRGCRDLRFGGPNDEAISGHPLHGHGLGGYRAHEVVNSQWISHVITVNSVHPQHSAALFAGLRHFVLLFHDEMLEVLAATIEARLVTGTLPAILADLAGKLTSR